MTTDLRVLKYGGSSLATPDHIRRVAEQIIEQRRTGQGIVVVASAMGGTTERLMALAHELTEDPPVRELDKLLCTGELASTALLCMALQRHGHDAVSLTGAQCGIRTGDDHFNAAVERVDTRRIRQELAAGRIVVAAGFQGENADREVTTLGLGGSDTTAVALTAALHARRCEICSDVDGVYSADPRVVSRASRLEEISYAEMVEMARHGASVLNPRAVEHARDNHVEIYSRSTFEPEAGGTLIHDVQPGEPRVVGIAGHDDLLPLVLEDTGDDAGAAAGRILEELDEDDVFLDHTDPETGRRDILIPAERLPDAESFGADLRRRFKQAVLVGPPSSSVSAIGLGVGDAVHMRNISRRYSEKAGVDLRNDFTAKHAITCVVQPEQASRLMNVLHRELECPADPAA